MHLLDSLRAFLNPTRRRGGHFLRDRLAALQVSVPVPSGCLDAFVRHAHTAASKDRSASDPYAERFFRQLEGCALFIHWWTAGDPTSSRPDWEAFVVLARRYSLPRAWRVSDPPGPTPARLPETFKVPAQLIQRSGESRGVTAPSSLPGEQVMADLAQAGMIVSEAPTQPATDHPNEADSASRTNRRN